MTRLTVVVPAKNEERLIERALRALAAQEMVAAGSFDVLVLANNCTDRTAQRAREFAAAHPHVAIDVLEAALPASEAHVGTARRLLMETAAERFERRGIDGAIASTDADTVVDRRWVANTAAALAGACAVAGRIDILGEELRGLPAPVREGYERDRRYYRAVAHLEATLDPLPWDPAPRHPDNFGASFALKTSAYRKVGGLPPLPRLEDLGLYLALLRADVPVRHAADVRVETSPRSDARLCGGFATHLHELGSRSELLVDDPRTTIETARLRGALRAMWRDEPVTVVSPEDSALRPQLLAQRLDRSRPFGENWERIDALLAPQRPRYPAVPLDFALEALSRAIASANAARPTRKRAASGAG